MREQDKQTEKKTIKQLSVKELVSLSKNFIAGTEDPAMCALADEKVSINF